MIFGNPVPFSLLSTTFPEVLKTCASKVLTMGPVSGVKSFIEGPQD